MLIVLLSQVARGQKPNIIYILADDLGYEDVSAYNNTSKIKTPWIDGLSKEGMLLTDAHSNSSVCTPTRYGILTGQYAWRTNLKNGVLWSYDKPLISSQQLTVAQLLKNNGYQTACIGKWHLGLDWATKNGEIDLTNPIKGGPTQDSYNLLPLLTQSRKNKYLRTSTIHHSIDGYFGIRKGDWKLALCRGSGGWNTPTETDPIKNNMPATQLYHLKNDPTESNNVYDKFPEIAHELADELEKIKNAYTEQQFLYKKIDTTRLYLSVYPSVTQSKTQKSPAMVFFFGGGWTSGTIKQFEPQAKYFSNRGITCFLVDYRVTERQKSTPFESLKDAKSAMRYIREHANELNIDTSKIIAAGGSAGGHLAAATALITDYNESTDNLNISCIPNALVLFNPVFDNGESKKQV